MAWTDEFDEELKPRVSLLTAVLCILNVVAALAFAAMLALDYQKRYAFSYAVFMHDVAMVGLPLEMEDQGTSASRVTEPKQRLTADQLKNVFVQRRTGASFTNFPEPFQPVDELFKAEIQTQHLDDSTLEYLFKKNPLVSEKHKILGDPVKTLEDELRRLKNDFPKAVKLAAREAVQAYKTDDEKRQALREKLLLPLCRSTTQIRDLNRLIEAASSKELEALVEEAAQRRMLVDALAPLEVFRPGDPEGLKDGKRVNLDQAADLDKVKVDQFVDLFKSRLDSAIADKFDPMLHLGKEWSGKERVSFEKRSLAAFTLFAIAQVKRPDKNLHLVSSAPERVQVVAGLHEYTRASQHYARALLALEEQVKRLIVIDREGGIIYKKDPDGNFTDEIEGRTNGFIQQYQAAVKELQTLQFTVQDRRDQIIFLTDQNEKVKTLVEDRDLDQQALTLRLLRQRYETRQLAEEVRKVNEDVFRAISHLADAQLINDRLESEIKLYSRKLDAILNPLPKKKGLFSP